MLDYDIYEMELEKNIKRNEKFFEIFNIWLQLKKLNKGTINNHIENAKLYINNYLNYHEVTKMEDGVYKVYTFFNDWFIRKCSWASESNLKKEANSIKMFYECMSQSGNINVLEYNKLCKIIDENMDNFVRTLININEYEGEEWEGFI